MLIRDRTVVRKSALEYHLASTQAFCLISNLAKMLIGHVCKLKVNTEALQHISLGKDHSLNISVIFNWLLGQLTQKHPSDLFPSTCNRSFLYSVLQALWQVQMFLQFLL